MHNNFFLDLSKCLVSESRSIAAVDGQGDLQALWSGLTFPSPRGCNQKFEQVSGPAGRILHQLSQGNRWQLLSSLTNGSILLRSFAVCIPDSLWARINNYEMFGVCG